MDEGDGLDPQDWEAFRVAAHRLLDAGIDRMRDARDHPWQPVPEGLQDRYAIGRGGDLVARLVDEVMPHHGGNTHPRFWGWVQGTGLASDVLAGIAGAVMNGNLGGRDHGAVYMERAVIDWTRGVMGFPEGASGVLVLGTSQATFITLAAARVRALEGARGRGQAGAKLVAYAGQGVHNATVKAIELLGIGSDNLRRVPLAEGRMDIRALRAMLAADRAAGRLPFAVIGTAGSVDLGLFDDLHGLADLAAEEGVWLHVDGAFGA